MKRRKEPKYARTKSALRWKRSCRQEVKTDWVSMVTQPIYDAHHSSLSMTAHHKALSHPSSKWYRQVERNLCWPRAHASKSGASWQPASKQGLEVDSGTWPCCAASDRLTSHTYPISTRIAHATQGRLCGLIARRWQLDTVTIEDRDERIYALVISFWSPVQCVRDNKLSKKAGGARLKILSATLYIRLR